MLIVSKIHGFKKSKLEQVLSELLKLFDSWTLSHIVTYRIMLGYRLATLHFGGSCS